MPTLTTKQHLHGLLQRNPSWSLAELSEKVGASRARVQQLLAELGYRYEPPVPGRWLKAESRESSLLTTQPRALRYSERETNSAVPVS